jgi:hypothetical protein
MPTPIGRILSVTTAAATMAVTTAGMGVTTVPVTSDAITVVIAAIATSTGVAALTGGWWSGPAVRSSSGTAGAGKVGVP